MVDLQELIRCQEQTELAGIVALNEQTAAFGLQLSAAEATALVAQKRRVLQTYHRVELGRSVLEQLILTFCDSAYISQSDYAATLDALQEIFFAYKNEALDLISDTELLDFMKEQFETVCCGDLDYLAGTCLERFTAAVRAGYLRPEQGNLSAADTAGLHPEMRWDKDIYLSIVKELFW